MKRIHNKEDIIQVGLDIVLSRGFNATGVEAILKKTLPLPLLTSLSLSEKKFLPPSSGMIPYHR
jgi:hypothetical protein